MVSFATGTPDFAALTVIASVCPMLLKIVLFWITGVFVPPVWVRLMPKVPPVTTWTFLTVTLEALIVRLEEMLRPLSTAKPSLRFRRPAPGAGESGGSRPVRIWVAPFRSVVMTFPSLVFMLSCHNHYRRYFSCPSRGEFPVYGRRGIFPVLGPGFLSRRGRAGGTDAGVPGARPVQSGSWW